MSKTITIPEPPKSVGDASAPDVRRAKRVLVVEGDGVTRWILLNSLRSVGLLVDFAPNSSIALYKFRHRSPDAILLDVQLRGNSGLDLIKAVRKDMKFSRKPIYVFTRAGTMGRSVRKVVNAEAAKVFDKSTTVPEWLAASIAKELTSSENQAQGATPSKADSTVPCTKEELQAMVVDLSVQERNLAQSKEVTQSITVCKDLRERAAAIVSSAGQAGMGNVARQAEALESLLDLICNSPKHLDDTSFIAVSLGTKTLESLGQDPVVEPPTQFAAVVVDETASSRTAVSDALADAGFVPTTFAAPAQALDYLARNPVDAIVTVGAGLAARGLEPSRIKKLPRHQNTPLLAVPSLAALNGTADTPFRFSDSSDANPIALMKLVLKALNLVQKAVRPGKAPPVPTAQPSPTLKASTVTPTAPVPPPLPTSPIAPAQELKPIAPTPAPTTAPQSEPPDDGKTIFFIEDDPIVLKAYGDRLQREGFKVVTAMDGLAALEMLLSIRPQAIVLDLMLPKLHGLEVLKFIRSDANLRATPVVVLSNVYMGALSEKAMEAGANVGMPKTQCSPNKLIKVIQKLIDGEAAASDQAPEQSIPEVTESHPEDSALAMARAELMADGPKEIVKMREDCLAYIRTAGNQESMDHLTNLYRGVRFLGGRAGLIGCTNVNDLTVAFEAVLFEIVFKASEPTASVLQTIAQAVDCLGRVFESGRLVFGESNPKYKVLVVDDDAVFNYTTTAALKRANLDVVATQDPVAGLQLLPVHRFDLVLLDINMPGMDGFAFCAELRRLPEYQVTPVVFVTMHAEFQNRARSLLVGGNDMIGKPVSPLELALKVTIRLLDSGAPKEVQAQTETGTYATATLDAQAPDQEEETLQGAVAATEEEIIPAPRQETVLTPVEQATPVSTEFSADTGRGLPESESEPAMAFQPSADPQESPQTAEAAASALVASPDDQSPDVSPVTPVEPATDQEMIAKLKQDREALVMRTYAVETELHNAKSRIERREKTIKYLQQKLEEFTVKQGTVERALAEPGESLEQTNPRAEIADDPFKGTELRSPQSTQDTSTGGKEWIERGSKPREEQPASQEAKAEAAKQAEGLRQQLSALIQAREEMSARLTKELEVSSESAKRIYDLERQLSEQTAALNRTETEARQQAEELRHQLVATMALEKQAEARATQLQDRCGQLEKDLAALTQTCEELNGRFAKEQQASSESAKRIQELEQQLAQSTTEQGSAKAEVAKQMEDLRRQVTTLKQAHEELNGRFSKEQQASSESAKRIQELENQLSQRAAALNQTEKQAHQQAEELRHQLVATMAGQKQAEAKGEQLQARCNQLEQDLAAATQAGQQIHTQFITKEQSASTSAKRVQELEQQLAHSASALSSIEAEAAKQAEAWHRQLVTTEAAQKAEQAKGEQLKARCGQLEDELAKLSQARDQVTGFFTKQQLASSELAKRVRDLENQLGQSTTALGCAKAEATKQAEDLRQQLATVTKAREELNGRLTMEQQVASDWAKRHRELEKQLGLRTLEAKQQETGLRHQLAEATAARKQAEAKGEQLQIRCGQLEKDLTAATQAREDLNARLGQEQRTSSESAKHVEGLEKELGQQKAEAKRQAEELNHQLMANAAAKKQAEASGEALRKRCSQLEKDLAALTQAREDLNGRFTREQQAASQSAKRVQELEQQLAQSNAALGNAKAEAAKQVADLGHQLNTSTKAREELSERLAKEQQVASEAAKRIQELEKHLVQRTAALGSAKAEAARQSEHFGQQLAAVTKARDELSERLNKEQQVASESAKRIQELQQQLAQTNTALGNAKAEAIQQTEDLRSQLAATSKAREELGALLSREQQVAAASANRIQELEKQSGLRTLEAKQQEAELRQQLAEANANQKQAEAKGEQLQTRCGQLEKDLVVLSQVRDELNGRFANEQKLSQELGKRIQELEKQLSQSSMALEHLQAAAMQQAAELRKQIADVSAAQKRAEARGEQLLTRCGQLEKDLATATHVREELSGRLTQEQQVSSEAAKRIQELEKQQRSSELAFRTESAEMEHRVRQGVESLTRATAELEKERVERNRIESHSASLATRMQELHEELSRHLASEQAAQQRIGKLEVNLRQRDEAANRLLAQLQQKIADHQLAEQQLQEAKQREDQLQKNVILFEQARKIYKVNQQDLESKFVSSLNALRESDSSVQKEAGERRQLAIELEATRQSLAEEAHKRQNAESQFDAMAKRLTEIQTRMQNEASERQRLAAALEAAQRDLRDQAQRNELELSKLQSALQLEEVEHKRLETQAMRLRRVTVESLRTGRVYRSNVRQKIGEPMDELCQSTRRLLQLDLNPEQDQLVRSVLEKALLVQANLVDGAPSPAEDGVADSELAVDNGAGQPNQTQA